jgi:YVTN family beta-propeller protein
VIEFQVLGSLEVVEGDRPLALGPLKQRALLAVLLLHLGEPVSSDRLIDALWGERAPPTAIKIVQGYVSNLRKVLGDGLLVTRGHAYALQAEPGQTDLHRFDSLVAEGRAALQEGDPDTAVARLREGLALWRGPPLADFTFETFAQPEIARLEESRLAAVEEQVDAELALGDHARLVGELEALVQEHPSRERLLGQLMLALYRSGRQGDALQAYRGARRRLVDELGLKPGRGLQELERAILAQDPGLDPPVRDAVRRRPVMGPRGPRGAPLIAAGGVLLLAVLIAVAVSLAGSGAVTVHVAPNELAAIDFRSDRVTAAVPVGARPGAVAYGSGSLWVTNRDDQSVSQVDPNTLRTLRAIRLSDAPTAIAAAPGGVWVVTSGPTATFVSASRIDPQFDTIDRTVRIPDVVPGSAAALAVRGSALWVAPSSGDLTRLDPLTAHVLDRLDPNSGPTGIDLAADGAVWVTDNDADNVTRVDATGARSPIAVGHFPSGIAIGAGGVWVADSGDDAVVRIDPSTRAVTTTIPVGHLPAGIAVGGGSVWVANSGDGTVMRIDPNTDKVIATIAVGGSPQAIAVAGHRVWVTVDARTISAGPIAGGTARLVTPYDVTSMDPALAYDSVSTLLLYATCAKLVNYPDEAAPAGSQLVPEVAQSLPARSVDGKSYTFTIRSGFHFSPPSTESVTAQTFKYSIERTLNPRMRSPLAGDYADIVGARAYMAGKANHISGVIARGDRLMIRLTAPAGDLPARMAEPAACAVPTNTPIEPQGERVIPAAGPYRVASYSPTQGVVLTRNPTYHGRRPRRLARIELAVGIPAQRAIAEVEAGTAAYAIGAGFDSTEAATLAARYGPRSVAAKSGHQQYFVNSHPQLDFLALNTHRPLFADLRLRQAVNYAVDRRRLARLGDYYLQLPEHPTDHYLPPGAPGYKNVHVYPLTPDLAKARRLARGHAGATVVLYTCTLSPCPEQALIVRTELAAIGLRVEIKTFPAYALSTKLATPGEPFDIGWVGWIPNWLDPAAMLNTLLESGTVVPSLDDPSWRARLAAAAKLTGTERYLTYARLDTELARKAAPLIAFGNLSSPDFFSARIGCQVFEPAYGMDLGALCTRHRSR